MSWLDIVKKRYKATIALLKSKKINLATDCSGLDTPVTCFDLVGLKYNHIFSCDNNKASQVYISDNHSPMYFFDDLKSRQMPPKLPKIDLYIAGFPCQSFSAIGKQAGFVDHRGQIIFYIIEFLRKYQPKIFILENVKQLLFIDQGRTFATILEHLGAISRHKKSGPLYDISYQVLNTVDYGLPQSRTRVYIVGIRKDMKLNRQFEFPEPFRSRDQIIDFLVDDQIYNDEQLSNNQIKILNEARPMIEVVPNRIYDLNMSNISRFRRGKENVCPCLTTKCDYYLPYYKRKLYPEEAIMLQGLPVMNLDNLSDHQIYRLAGNGMSCNVILCVMLEALKIVKWGEA